jgi:hypothetical protein
MLPDLANFGVVLSAVLTMLAVAAHLVLGYRVKVVASLGDAIYTTFKWWARSARRSAS